MYPPPAPAATPLGHHEAGGRGAVAGIRNTPPEALEPCLRCATLLPVRLMGCKGGSCPNCGHLYPHGDCSD